MTSHPHDQADGFSENNDDWTRRQAMGAYDDVWDFLFSFERLSGAKDWDEMRRDLAEFKVDIPYHEFSAQAFRNAARAGQVDILEQMLAKKFRLPDDEAESLAEDLAHSPLPAAEAGLRFLLDNGCKGDRAVDGIAERGSPAMMEVLRQHGCDILQRGDSFTLALHTGNTGVMEYLYEQGADIYTPAAVRGIYGGIDSYQSRKGVQAVGSPDAARNAHATLCALDTRRWMAFYASLADPPPALNEFQSVPDGVADRGMTLLQLAARAGCIDDAIEIAARTTGNPLTADDFLRPAESGASVISVLAARGEAHKIFDARLWWRAPDDVAKLQEAVKALGAGAVIDPPAFTAELQRYRLRLSSSSAPRLKPPKP